MAGGVPALVRWAKTDPGAFYAIWSRMLPSELKVSGEGAPIALHIIQQVVTTPPVLSEVPADVEPDALELAPAERD